MDCTAIKSSNQFSFWPTSCALATQQWCLFSAPAWLCWGDSEGFSLELGHYFFSVLLNLSKYILWSSPKSRDGAYLLSTMKWRRTGANKFNTSQSVWNRSLANLNSKSYFSTRKFVLSWPDTNSLSHTCCTKNLAWWVTYGLHLIMSL